MAIQKATSMFLTDELGGKRRVKNITDLDLKDGGGAEAVFNIEATVPPCTSRCGARAASQWSISAPSP